MALERVSKYNINLFGDAGGVPTYNEISIVLHTSSGQHTYHWNVQTADALTRAQILIDILRNEGRVFYDPVAVHLYVPKEEVGEKDSA